jgi:hypothetical protein
MVHMAYDIFSRDNELGSLEAIVPNDLPRIATNETYWSHESSRRRAVKLRNRRHLRWIYPARLRVTGLWCRVWEAGSDACSAFLRVNV